MQIKMHSFKLIQQMHSTKRILCTKILINQDYNIKGHLDDTPPSS